MKNKLKNCYFKLLSRSRSWKLCKVKNKFKANAKIKRFRFWIPESSAKKYQKKIKMQETQRLQPESLQ